MDYSIYISEQDYVDLKRLLPLLGKIIFSVDQTKQEQQLYSRFDDNLRKTKSPGTAISAKIPGNVNSAQIVHIGGDNEDMQKLKYGTGSISRRQRKRKDGTYRRFYQGRIYRNGKQVTVYGSTQAECLAKLKALREEIEIEKRKIARLRKSEPEAAGGKFVFRTYGEWLDEWVKQFKKGNLREDYFEEFSRRVAKIKEDLGELQLRKIESLELLHYLNSMPKRNSTVKTYDIINGSLQKAEDFGIIKRNPCKVIERPTYTAQKRRAFELSEQTKILSALNERYSKAFYFLCCTGLRIGEFLALQPCDVDFDRHFIRVDSAMSLKSGKDKETKTIAGVRKVYFADELFEVFGTDALGTFTYYGIKKAFSKVYKKLGIKGVSLTHSCRHTFSSLLYAVKVSDKIIQLQMGHADVATTMETYTDILMKGESPILDYIRKLKSTLNNTLLSE